MMALPIFILSILRLIRGRDVIPQTKLFSSRTLLNEVISAATCTVRNANWIGDGWCDEEYNTYECNYDMGDCCQSTCNHLVCGVLGYQCKNPDAEENKKARQKPNQGGKEGSPGGVTNGNQGDTGTGGSNGNQGDASEGSTGNQGGGNSNQGDSGTGGGSNNQGDASTGGGNSNQGDSGTGGGNGNQGDASGGSTGNQGGGNGNQGDSGTGGGNSNQGDSGTGGNNSNQGDTNGESNGNQGDTSGGTTGNQGDSDTGGGNSNQGDTSEGTTGNQGDTNGGSTGNQGDTNGGSTGNQGDASEGSNGNQGDASEGNNGNQGDASEGSNSNQGYTPLPSQRPSIIPTLMPTLNPSAIPTSDTEVITDDQSNIKGIYATRAPSMSLYSAFNFTFYLMNTTMDCFDKSDSWVTRNEEAIRCALEDYCSISSITNVTFFPLNPIRNSTAYISSKISNYGNNSRNLLGTLQATMIATTINVGTLTSRIMIEKSSLISSMKSGKLEKSIRSASRQSSGLALDYAVVCSSDSIQNCLSRAISSYSSLDQCSMATSNWDHLYARQSFKGYVIWISVLIILWTFLFGIATGPIIFLRFDLWPSFRTWISKTSAKALVAARFKQGCSVAFLSICRIVQLALIISLTFDLEAPNFACVEFAFNREVENDSTETFSTPLLEALQSIFYFFFLLAVLCRQNWFDAEIRRHGIIIHGQNSRFHMSMCSFFRQILSVIAVIGVFGVLLFLIIVSVKQKNSRTSKDFSMVIRASQITCALLTITIQLYHWKALWGIATVPYNEDKEEREDIFCSLEGGDRKRSKRQNEQKILAKVQNQNCNRELSYSEIFTGDSDVAGNSSISGTNRKGNMMSDSLKKKQKQPKIEKALDPTFPPPISGDDPAEGVVLGTTDDGVLLTENFTQFTSSHCPIISDNSAWIVLVTCIWFLITSIPEFLRFYLSAFLLYSTITRILEIVTASLFLSPFIFRNTPLRRRLAAKIKKEASLQLSSRQKKLSERGESSNFILNDENYVEDSLTTIHNPHHSSSARPLKVEGRLEYEYEADKGNYDFLEQGKRIGDKTKNNKDNGPGSRGTQSQNDRSAISKQQSGDAWVNRWLGNSNSISTITAATDIARDYRPGENNLVNSVLLNKKENQKQDNVIQEKNLILPRKLGSIDSHEIESNIPEEDTKETKILRPLFNIPNHSKQPLPYPGSLKYRSNNNNVDIQGRSIIEDTNTSLDCLTVSTRRTNNKVKIEKIEAAHRICDDSIFNENNGNRDSRNSWINKSDSRLTRRKFVLDDFDSKSPKSPKSK